MAFQQAQQRPQAQRPQSHVRPASEQQLQQSPAHSAQKRHLAESQEWILFSPTQHELQSRTSDTPRTATYFSDFGSLETHVRSQPATGSAAADANDAAAGDATLDAAAADDDDAELDSLDDGLHAFHHPFSASSAHALDQSGGSVLPRHDGFGGFPSAAGLQEQLWQFERYNPQRRRHAHRRSSVQQKLDAMDEEREADVEDERNERIERWRLDQSRVVMDEIEKETRRRRRRMSRTGASMVDTQASLRAAHERSPKQDSVMVDAAAAVDDEGQPRESFWQRITRKVIQDLIGMDDNTLSVIFGESLVGEDTSPTPRQPSPLAVAASHDSRVSFSDPSHSWEAKLLDRIARELGVLVNQLSSHDGAFSSYQRAQLSEPDYAGLGLPTRDPPAPRSPSLRQRRRRLSERAVPASPTTADSLFGPTLGPTALASSDAPDSSLWGIEEEPSQELSDPERKQQADEQAYWERELDVQLIFSYLRDRFSHLLSGPSQQPGQPQSATQSNGPPLPASWATNSTSPQQQQQQEQQQQQQQQQQQDSYRRRAELIRRQHPLVSAAAQQQSRRRHHESLLRRQLLAQRQQRTGSSSCASQSTRRSRHSRSASSRHFWDLGGSVGSVGSGAVLGGSAVGGWGEV